MDQVEKERNCTVSHIKWIMREDADSLVVTASSKKMSCLQVWELREKALPVHKSLSNSETSKFFNTVVSILQFGYNDPQGTGQHTKGPDNLCLFFNTFVIVYLDKFLFR